jgi:hypothetical protein
LQEKANQPATAKVFRNLSNGWSVASMVIFSKLYDPKGTKPYGTWDTMVNSYADSGSSQMAALIEQGAVDEMKNMLAVCEAAQDLQKEVVESVRKHMFVDDAMKKK